MSVINFKDLLNASKKEEPLALGTVEVFNILPKLLYEFYFSNFKIAKVSSCKIFITNLSKKNLEYMVVISKEGSKYPEVYSRSVLPWRAFSKLMCIGIARKFRDQDPFGFELIFGDDITECLANVEQDIKNMSDIRSQIKFFYESYKECKELQKELEKEEKLLIM